MMKFFWWGIFIVTIKISEEKNFNLDFSNVDLAKFNYFRYAPTPIYYIPSRNIWVRPIPKREHKIVKTVKKAKAVYDYLKQVLVGDPLSNRRMNFVFDQNRAERDREEYEKHFGKHGEKLIEWLGTGNNTNELRYYGFYNKQRLRKFQ